MILTNENLGKLWYINHFFGYKIGEYKQMISINSPRELDRAVIEGAEYLLIKKSEYKNALAVLHYHNMEELLDKENNLIPVIFNKEKYYFLIFSDRLGFFTDINNEISYFKKQIDILEYLKGYFS